MRVCVIPARGGSKRIPRKNIRSFCGKPMLHWSIEAANRSGCFDRVVVSTDDPEIAASAEAVGAEVPFMRPLELSDDYTSTLSVIRHAITVLDTLLSPLDAVCCLYATAPFTRACDLQAGLSLLEEIADNAFVFTAAQFSTPIQRALRLSPNGLTVSMVDPACFDVRSQDLETTYFDAAQFYWGRPQAWLSATNIFEGARAVLLPRWCVQDIDTPEDWRRAELMHAAWSAQLHPEAIP